MISLVMLNWKRPKRVSENVERYVKYEFIDEIIVVNNNLESGLKLPKDDKLIVIESNKDLGLFSRYAAGGLAKNNCIMHIDDDLYLEEDSVNYLYDQWKKSPDVCHGTQGRVTRPEYSLRGKTGRVEVILTRCMLTSKKNCLSAFSLSLEYENLDAIPKGNGEDIILSYASILQSGELNIAHRIDFINHPENKDPNSIHKKPGHLEHRKKLTKKLQKALSDKGIFFNY